MLAAISSLKRALGIPNHSTKRDEFRIEEFTNDKCCIYLPDEEAAKLVAELLFSLARKPRGEREAVGDPFAFKVSEGGGIKVEALDEGGYVVSFRPRNSEVFGRKLLSVIARHIQPEKGERVR